jgi:hypothetical protein
LAKVHADFFLAFGFRVAVQPQDAPGVQEALGVKVALDGAELLHLLGGESMIPTGNRHLKAERLQLSFPQINIDRPDGEIYNIFRNEQ